MSSIPSLKSNKHLQHSIRSIKENCSQIAPHISNSFKALKNTFTSKHAFKPKDLFTTECAIPIFIVPSGSTPNDYKIHADFSLYESMSIDAYKIPLPQIEVYSAHSLRKFNFETFLDTFILTFSDYFHSSMQNIHNEYDDANKIEKIKFEDVQNEESGWFGKCLTAIGAVGVMAIAKNPVVDLLFLLVALSSGGETTKDLLKTIKENAKSMFQTSNTDNAFEKDKKELKAKEALVRKALSNTELKIHHGLVALQELINNEYENKSLLIKKLTLSKPSIMPILHNHNFISSFPQEIQSKLNQL